MLNRINAFLRSDKGQHFILGGNIAAYPALLLAFEPVPIFWWVGVPIIYALTGIAGWGVEWFQKRTGTGVYEVADIKFTAMGATPVVILFTILQVAK